jgi:hypothetical protein
MEVEKKDILSRMCRVVAMVSVVSVLGENEVPLGWAAERLDCLSIERLKNIKTKL